MAEYQDFKFLTQISKEFPKVGKEKVEFLFIRSEIDLSHPTNWQSNKIFDFNIKPKEFPKVLKEKVEFPILSSESDSINPTNWQSNKIFDFNVKWQIDKQSSQIYR